MQAIVNNPITIPFLSSGLTTGVTTFTKSTLLNGVPVVYPSFTFTEIGGGLYTMTFTPTTTGTLSIFIQGVLLPQIDIVSRTLAQQLQDISDEAIGSWTWDKTTGILQLYRLDGTSFHSYNVVDTLSNASKELIS